MHDGDENHRHLHKHHFDEFVEDGAVQVDEGGDFVAADADKRPDVLQCNEHVETSLAELQATAAQKLFHLN